MRLAPCTLPLGTAALALLAVCRINGELPSVASSAPATTTSSDGAGTLTGSTGMADGLTIAGLPVSDIGAPANNEDSARLEEALRAVGGAMSDRGGKAIDNDFTMKGAVHSSYPDSTAADRLASFARYANARLGQSTVAEFLGQRSAPLFDDAGCSYAVAIDRRGYYLTAAHCVRDGPAMLSGSKTVGQPETPATAVRVVWSGDPDQAGSDLAILFVDSPPGEVFEWTTEFRKGDVVFSTGLTQDNPQRPDGPVTYTADFTAGKILEIPREPAVPLRAGKFTYDAPLHHGDSGGPMVAADGRLIAINTGGGSYMERDFQRRRPAPGASSPAPFALDSPGMDFLGQGPAPVEGTVSYLAAAYRPDLAWLGQILDADSAVRAAEAKGDVAGAIMAVGRVLDLDPKNVAALDRRHGLEDRKGDHAAAVADCDRALAIDPKDFNSLGFRISDDFAREDYRAVIANLSRGLKLSPDDDNLFYVRAWVKFKRADGGDSKDAISDIAKAIALHPKSADIFFIRGLVRLAFYDRQGANSDFETAVHLDPRNGRALNGRAAERKIRGDWTGALADWAQAIAVEPDPVNRDHMRLYLALTMVQEGQPDAGFAQEVAGWKESPDRAMGLFVAGQIDETALLAAAGQATDVLDHQSLAYYCIGVMRLVRGDKSGARESFQKSIATGVKDAMAPQFASAELSRLGPR